MRTSRHIISPESILFVPEWLILIFTVVILSKKLRSKNNRDSLFLCMSVVTEVPTERSRGHASIASVTKISVIGSAKLHARSIASFNQVTKLSYVYFAKQ